MWKSFKTSLRMGSLLGSLAAGPCFGEQDTAAARESLATPLEEIVVTAQKRSEKLIDVPISITALQSQDLIDRGALSYQDYQAYVPGLSSTGIAPGYNQITVRGVTTGINQLSATTGTYFDETPTNSSTATSLGSRLTPDPDLLDIARMEVLRGPQGTLYGANALGGVIRYVLVEPNLHEFDGRVQTGVTSVDHGGVGYVERGAVDGPIVDGKLAARVSGFYTRDAGYIDTTSGRADVNRSANYGGRLSMLWAPGEDFTATLSSLYQKRTVDGFGSETVNEQTLEPTHGRYRQNIQTPEFVDTRYSLQSLKMDFDLGFANLISATGYGHQVMSLSLDASDLLGPPLGLAGVSVPLANDLKKFTQELRLVSKTGGRFEYIVGAYYTDERSDDFSGTTGFLAPDVLAPPPFNPLVAVDLLSTYREIAGFANGTLNFTDQFNVQVGGRFSHNKQQFSENLDGLLFGPLAGSIFDGTSSENATTWAATPQLKITPDMVVYARVAKGFRPGGTNLVPPGGEAIVKPTYESDSLVNYELGFKSAAFEKRLSLSVDAFYIDWKGIQTTAALNGFNYLVNGGKARSEGVEGELRWSIDSLTIGANGSYMDAITRDAIPSVGALAGDPLPYVPKWSGALTADQAFRLGGSLEANVGASVRYTGSQYPYYSQATASNPGGLRLSSVTLVDLRAGLRRDRYDVSLFVENVFDKHAYTNVQTDFANPVTGDGARATIVRPRTIGLMLGAKF